ncbi:hypothetical protein C8F04DRAFT_1184747 [Mycena alexandri]|uniref:Uncharacterized protein n=1 Tax=Mycena alexandri TaxID=1745969 RepID=A0AAD6X174_9AGAR|nr:hypothetical protein C8F04DRAFT_1184747 [Mycena alexandri]
MCRPSSPAAHRKAGPTFSTLCVLGCHGPEPDGLAAKAESHIGRTRCGPRLLAEPAQKSTTLRRVVSRCGFYSDGIFVARYKAPELEVHARGVWLWAHTAGAVFAHGWIGWGRFAFGLGGDMRSRFESALQH